MSDHAFTEYQEARQVQLTKNDARRIRTKVKDAWDNLPQAGRRWPFELLQNAHDSGPRSQERGVSANYLWRDTSITFSHDGMPFSVSELAALLSGGSSKEFESEETTGRFGTGFLVTHILGKRVGVSGLLSAKSGLEHFSLDLERDGDEEQICHNVEQCNDAIRAARSVTGACDESAAFTYHSPNREALSLGFKALTEAIPYLFGTCQHLCKIKIEHLEGLQDVWALDSREEFEFADCLGVQSRVVRSGRGRENEVYLCLRVTRRSGNSALLVVLQGHDKEFSVYRPQEDFPRVFSRFPIRPSVRIGTTVVIDAPFDVNQERNRVGLTSKNKQLFADAFEMVPSLCRYGMREGWIGAHWLSKLAPVQPSDGDEKVETDWLSDLISRTAKDVARLPLVWTESGLLPADSTERPHAACVLPKYSTGSMVEDSKFETVFALTDETTLFYPPLVSLAKDWQTIFSGWKDLGVSLNQITLESLAHSIKVNVLRDLPVRNDGLRWLARFIDAVGFSWKIRKGIDKSIFQGLLPDQKGYLTSPEHLSRESELSEALKDVSESIGIPIRSRLLDSSLVRAAAVLELEHFASALGASLRDSITEEGLIRDCIEKLQANYPERGEVEDDTITGIVGSIRLLEYLEHGAEKGLTLLAQQVPLLTVEKTIVRWNKSRMLMAPVSTWQEPARPFHSVYPADRILAEIYTGDPALGIPNVVPSLVKFEIAVADPLSVEVPKELKEKRLAAIAEPGQDTSGVTVSGEVFSQISFLHMDLLNRCQERQDLARALLGLLLCYIAQHDASWREVRAVMGKRKGLEVPVQVRRSLWLSDLKRVAWVPIPTDDGEVEKHVASPSSLRPLLNDPSWLVSNEPGISLLTEFFGFEPLEVRLLGLDPSVATELRQQLSELMHTLGTKPADYISLIGELQRKEARRKQVESCRKFGLAVQAAVEQCLRSCEHVGDVRLVDKGYDYAVYLETGDIGDAATDFELGPYLVEVKATTDGVVRLTSTQAAVASARSERFVLCVVDLRHVTADRLAEDWTAEHVMPIARFVSNIGTRVAGTTDLIESAKVTDIPIKNDSALRYAISPAIWETYGVLVEDWIRSAVGS